MIFRYFQYIDEKDYNDKQHLINFSGANFDVEFDFDTQINFKYDLLGVFELFKSEKASLANL